MTAASWRENVRAALMENMGLKLVSLFCALALYAFFQGAGNTAERTFSVGVVVLRPPDSANRVLLVQPPTEVGITLRGPRSQLDDLHAEDIGSLPLDLRNGTETRIDLEPSMFHVPPSLTIEQIIPQTVKIRWDDVIERSIQVQVARTGEPATGFVVKGAIKSDPEAVIARGPKTIVEVLQFARAAPFDVTGLTAPTRRTLALDKPPQLVTWDLDNVVATVDVVRETKTTKFTHLKVEVVGVPRARTIPETVTVVVSGTPEDVSSILPEAIVPRVEPKTAGLDVTKPNSAMIRVIADVPRVKVDVDPPQVLVKW